MKLILSFGLALLTLVGGAPFARAQSNCPDVRASQIAARVDTGDTVQCKLAIVILGVKVGIGGTPCPTKKWSYPAHQECLGEENVGTMCAFEGSMNVRLELCRCLTLGTSDFGLTFPECVCAQAGIAGTIEDFGTVNCNDAT